MEYTAEKIKDEITEKERSEMLESLQENEDVPDIMKGMDMIKDVWIAGCWLNNKLDESEKSEDEKEEIGFEHGRISLGMCPYEMAARQMNKYVIGKDIETLTGSLLQHNV